MINTLIIFLPIVGGLVRYGKQSWIRSQWLTAVSIAMAMLLAILRFAETNVNVSQLFSLHVANHFELGVTLMSDGLSRVMTLAVLFIGFIAQTYSERYLRSDACIDRFQFQMSLCLTSVLLFVNAANLFTAFVGWQMIGIALYLLLNHYHFDLMANRAAKKKFVINRVGDVCFIIALAVVYQQSHNGLFSQIGDLNQAWLIGSLITIAIMTKSAQFPFHIWLPDTMEAPTPVSALMHAGIINAGGILLVRLYPLISQVYGLMLTLSVVGCVTLLAGSIYALSQYDVKRKLAYSTMGQMGYMVMQVGLGLPVAAVFHLIAHGFMKASLFLNAGSANTLNRLHIESSRTRLFVWVLIAVTWGVLLGGLGWLLCDMIKLQLPLLIKVFITITLAQVLLWSLEQRGPLNTLYVGCLLLAALSVYLVALKGLSIYFAVEETPSIIPLKYQIITAVFLVCSQLAVWLKPLTRRLINSSHQRFVYEIFRSKYYVERFFRYCGLYPIRKLGDQLLGLITKYRWLLICLGVCLFGYLMLDTYTMSFMLDGHHHVAMVVTLIMLFCSLTVANRAKSLLGVFWGLFVFELLVTLLHIEMNKWQLGHWAVFHLVNSLPIFIMFILIVWSSTKVQSHAKLDDLNNAISWPLFYLSTGLFLLLAIPGSASFIEVYDLIASFYSMSVLGLISLGIMLMMLTITVLHALQTYVFGDPSRAAFNQSLPIVMHCFCWGAILLNVMAGMMPQKLMTLL